MTRYLLDTSILNHALKPALPATLQSWLGHQSDRDLYIASLTIAEIRRGLLTLPTGNRRIQLESWFYGPEGPQALFAGRVLPFDERAGLIWARLMAEGRARNALDMIVAAIAEANGCVVVTDNEKGFAGMTIVNPL
jgi:toxin FitB